MSISANFPHQLALLVIALQTDKLPICTHLENPTEKSLVASLMTYMNNRDFRTPITISRKTLGLQIRVKRSTLFNKLRSLKEKGLLEDVTGEKPIRFTEKAIALMQQEWTKQADRWNEKSSKKQQTFRVGNSVFPQDLLALINRGVSEKQLRGLLSEAKKAGQHLQHILRDFAATLAKYEGNILFFVIRDMLRKPAKYVKKSQNDRNSRSSFDTSLLRTAIDNAKCILSPGEHLTYRENEYWFSSEQTNWAPHVVTDQDIDLLRQRMRACIDKHLSDHPGWDIPAFAKPGYRIEPDRTASNDVLFSYRLLNTRTGDIVTMKACWHSVYLALPVAARCIPEINAQQSDKRLGRLLIRRGVKYVVECIDGTLATLRVLTGKSEGRVCPLPVDNLADPEVQWLR